MYIPEFLIEIISNISLVVQLISASIIIFGVIRSLINFMRCGFNLMGN